MQKHTRPAPRAGLIVVVALTALAWAPGADPASPARPLPRESPQPSQLSETETVRLVLLSATVTDRRGRPIEGLTEEEFRVYEGGAERPIELFATEGGIPISVAVLLDLSGSMRLGGKLAEAKRLIRTFVAALGAEDRFGLIGFADEQVSWITEFTSDRAEFLQRLDVQQGLGRTALWDALAASPELVDREIRGRRAIVLLTDGVDNASELSELQAVWIARRVDVPIYTLSFLPMPEEDAPERIRDTLRTLQRFSEASGGALYPVRTRDELEAAVAQIQQKLRFQYVIGFYPAPGVWDGSFRPVTLEVERGNYRVRTRQGYYAEP